MKVVKVIEEYNVRQWDGSFESFRDLLRTFSEVRDGIGFSEGVDVASFGGEVVRVGDWVYRDGVGCIGVTSEKGMIFGKYVMQYGGTSESAVLITSEIGGDDVFDLTINGDGGFILNAELVDEGDFVSYNGNVLDEVLYMVLDQDGDDEK